MATITKELMRLENASVEIDYDDVTLLLLAVRAINNSNIAIGVSLTSNANGRTYSATLAANSTQTLTIPTAVATRIPITIASQGRVDGVDFYFKSPP